MVLDPKLDHFRVALLGPLVKMSIGILDHPHGRMAELPGNGVGRDGRPSIECEASPRYRCGAEREGEPDPRSPPYPAGRYPSNSSARPRRCRRARSANGSGPSFRVLLLGGGFREGERAEVSASIRGQKGLTCRHFRPTTGATNVTIAIGPPAQDGGAAAHRSKRPDPPGGRPAVSCLAQPSIGRSRH